jgi:hypothetical protein
MKTDIDDNWDRNDYQGRSRKNVETGYKLLMLSTLSAWLVFLGWGIYEFIKFIF